MNYAFGTRAQPLPLLIPEVWNSVKPNWKQVHGTKVDRVIQPKQECGEVDALWTTTKIPLGIITADCVPVLLFRKDQTAVAVLHAGWRGTFEGVVREFFKTLPTDFNGPSDWKAILGPSIRACCYEVSTDLIDSFDERLSQRNPQHARFSRKMIEPTFRKLDLIAILRQDLELLSIEIESIHPDCTFCASDSNFTPKSEPKYFSYRKGDRKSRQYSIIQL